MAAVYEVLDRRTQRRRALKRRSRISLRRRLAPGSSFEARVTANVESEHIVETFDAGVDPETNAPFLVTELLRGEDLATVSTEVLRWPRPRSSFSSRRRAGSTARTRQASFTGIRSPAISSSPSVTTARRG